MRAQASDRDRFDAASEEIVADLLEAGFAVLTIDLLMTHEAGDPRAVFGIKLLAGRLATAIGWARRVPLIAGLPLGLMASGTASAAVLAAAAECPDRVGAVVAVAGRPDLAAALLDVVRSPTLLIVGENDRDGLELSIAALARLRCEKALRQVPGAGQGLSQAGATRHANAVAAEWFTLHLATGDSKLRRSRRAERPSTKSAHIVSRLADYC